MSDNLCLHEAIDQHAEADAHAVAIEQDGAVMRRGELKQLSDVLASQLIHHGVVPDSIVALAMPRSFELVVALLAVVKARGAYLPLDLDYPEERLEFILADANPKVILADGKGQQRLAEKANVALWTVDLQALRDQMKPEKLSPAEPESLAYVIYTSGSTGQPKGCLLEHRALINRLNWMQKQYPITVDDAVLQKTPYTFDVSVWEFIWPLIMGARLVLARPGGHKDNHYLMQCVDEYGVTVCHFVPSMLRQFINDLTPGAALGLRHLFTSGEALSYALMRETRDKLPTTQLHNLYGPTEAAIDVSYWDCEERDDGIVPIGRAIDGIDLLILDENAELVADGEPGELHIAGIGLARGYLNREQLTAERFFEMIDASGNRRRVYKTGDRVKRLADGNITYLGRLDFQVKIRGFRIELGEIEAALLALSEVSEAVVMVDDRDQEDPRLVAHIVAQNDDVGELRNRLSKSLPEHMLPNRFVFHKRLPQTMHGKVDRKSLAQPADSAPPSAAENNIEQRVTHLVAEYIDGAVLAPDDDLFDHGATSFTLMRLSRALEKKIGVKLTLESFLQNPTIGGIVACCEEPHAGDSANEASAEISASAPTKHPKPDLGSPSESNSSTLDHEKIGQLCRETMDVEQLDVNADLFELGATSFTLMRLARAIEKETGITIPLEVFLENPTLNGALEALNASSSASVETAVTRTPQADNVSPQKPKQDTSSRAEPLTAEREYSIAVCLTQHDGVSGENPVPDGVAETALAESNVDSVTADEASPAAEAQMLSLAIPPSSEYIGANLSPAIDSSATTISLQQLGRFLARLGSVDLGDRQRYLYPSGGGKYPLQVYLEIAEGAVSGLSAGAYYYHPESHQLQRLEAGNLSLANGVRLALVAQLKALEQTYDRLSPLLATLDAGYMIQLLCDGQAEENLAISAVGEVEYQSLQKVFCEQSSQRVVTQLSLTSIVSGASAGRVRQLSINPVVADSYAGADYKPTQLTASEQQAYTAGRLHLRTGLVGQSLPTRAFSVRDYVARASIRNYARHLIDAGVFKQFIALLAAEMERIDQSTQTGIAFNTLIKSYILVRENAIEGVAAGLWRFNAARGELALCKTNVQEIVRNGVYPFNRGHFDQAAFTVILVAPQSTVSQTSSLATAVLAAGMLGQTLMRRQAEFDLGLCPIGWMHLDPAREACGLDKGDVFIHGFTGGFYAHNQPLPLSVLEQQASGPAWQPQRATASRDKLAVIGISGRFPGARDIWRLWQTLEAKQSSIEPLPQSRWNSPELRGGFLDHIDQFDSLLFNITPLEAKTMDPQERLFLEVVWECLESAGYTPQRLQESAPTVGVFVGVMWGDYQKFGSTDGEPGPTSTYSSIPNRVSHFFNFRGPSMAVDTGCSSALTALHLAAESLHNGECDAAIVGGVNLISHPDHIRVLNDLDLLATDGKSHIFGAEGDGWIIGEGVGAMLLRPNKAASASRDLRYALISGSTTAHRGRSRGRTTPNSEGQVASLHRLFQQSGHTPESVAYVEASAAGSGIADAAELSALERVLGAAGHRYQLGSVKGNLGHLEAASGMAQLAKVVLQMQNMQIAATIAPDDRNPFIDWNNSMGSLVTESQPWPDGTARCALINGYSAEGSCSHVLLEAAPEGPRETRTEQAELIVLSAESREQLREYATSIAEHLSICSKTPEAALPALFRAPRLCDLAYTLQVGRAALRYRFAAVVHSLPDAIDTLRQLVAGRDQNIAEIDDERCGQQEAVAPGSLEGARDAWLRGAVLNWQSLPTRQSDVRVMFLPAYPFASQRHWLAKNLSTAGQTEVLEQKTSIEELPTNTDEAQLTAELAEELCRIYAEESQIPHSRVRPQAPLESLGLNSLLITRINKRLVELGIGVERRTLLFEYRSLAEVAAYLLRHHKPAIVRRFNQSGTGNEQVDQASDKATASADHQPTSEEHSGATSEAGIAIIGLAGQYPDAESMDALWENLIAGRNSVREIPRERWDWRENYDQTRGRNGYNYSRYGAFVENALQFDPLFFNISPHEAETMDPQERLFLQTAWAAVEDAGIPPASLRHTGPVGVFVGVMNDTYERAAADAAAENPTARAQVTRYWSIANRVSYQLDVSGPSMAVDTACSSSLAALHLACESLRRNESSVALAGGVNLVLHPSHYISLSSVTMLSEGDQCRPFGDRADGTVIGEGAGCVLLKPLRRAVADGDHIYGVIRGSAINSDGRTNGYTVANPRAQAEVVASALDRAGVDPRTVTCLEAHGTGTALGDPIEVEGLCQAYAGAGGDRQYCALGSIKSNIGHLESAAGIAGLTKLLLQMQHGRYAPTLHAEPCNPDIELSKTPFRLQTEAADWPRLTVQTEEGEAVELPRRAGISSFGAGGVNVHAVVEEYIAEPPAQRDSGEQANIIVLSARRRERLRSAAARLRSHAANHAALNLRDIAFTLQTGRQPMRCRLAFVVSNTAELITVLDQYLTGDLMSAEVLEGEVSEATDSAELPVEDDTINALRKIAQQWVEGKDVAWHDLPVNQAARRLSLPTYPFLQQEYWIGAARNSADETSESKGSSPEPERLPVEPPPAPSPVFDTGFAETVMVRDDGPRHSGSPGTLWLLDDDGDLSRRFAGLADDKHRVVVIQAADDFSQRGDRFLIDPLNKTHWQQLVEQLVNRQLAPSAVINGWQPQGLSNASSFLEQQLQRGFYTWIYLFQALVRGGHRQPTRFVSWMSGRDRITPTVSAQESLFRTLAVEYSWVSAAVVRTDDTSEQCVSQMANELHGGGVEYIHYRDDQRWRKSYKPFNPGEPSESSLSRGGVCVLAGGGGGIGQHLARYLLDQGADTVVLLGRSRNANFRLQENVFYRCADIADRQVLESALAGIRASFGDITGVVQCAGSLRNARVNDKQPLDMSMVLAPKVFGTANLHALTCHDPLDYFILFSSLTAEVAAPGQADYAYANGFLDQYANWREHERKAGRCAGKTLSVNWPFWRDGGMAMDGELLDLLSERWGVSAIDSEWGLAALRRLRSADCAQVLALPGDARKIQQTLKLDVEAAEQQASASPESKPVLQMSALMEDVAAISKIDTSLLDEDTALTEYGFDSVMLTRLSQRFSERFNYELTPSDLIENPTLSSLHVFLREVFGRNVTDHEPGEPEPQEEKVTGVNASFYHPLLGNQRAFEHAQTREIPLNTNSPVVSDHRVRGKVVLPGSALVEMAGAAGSQYLDCDSIEVSHLSWQQALQFEGDAADVGLRLEHSGAGCRFTFTEIHADGVYAQGNISRLSAENRPDALDISAIKQRSQQRRSKAQLYADFNRLGLEYGPLYQGIQTLYIGESEALSHIVLDPARKTGESFVLHPSVLDCAFQSAVGAASTDSDDATLQLPFFVKSIRLYDTLPEECWVHVQRSANSSARVERFNLRLCDADGRTCATIEEFSVMPVDKPAKKTKPEETAAQSKTSRRSSRAKRTRRQEKIAVIGMSARLPQSPDIETYWRHLRDGRNMISEVTPDRWDWRSVFDSRKGQVGKTYSRWAGYLDDVYHYDPAFFKIREQDATAMDLQHLLLLELSQQLFDAAGYRRDEVAGSNTAVILGAAADDCPVISNKNLTIDVAKSAVVNSIQNMIAARISDFYDLKGEALTMDTACSSSLVAINNACRILRSGDCDMAIAGGVTLLLSESAHIRFSQASVLSDEPRSYVFDKRAKGFVLGEGAGLVLLKRYDDAVADGDPILGVVSGSAINNDGRTMGITTPNVDMQRAVIRQAIDNAGVDPASIGYLEAHGTGTLLGDPIEIKAATQAYSDFTRERQYCAVGSVKSNMGHTLLAAGVASFIKVILMLQHRFIPRTLHCDTPHPRFDFERTPFYPELSGEDWQPRADRCRAAISGFGFGGTNCHMILEQFLPQESGYQQARFPLPETPFKRIHCRPDRIPLQQPASRSPLKEVSTQNPVSQAQSYADIIEALQQGQITVEQAMVLESRLAKSA